MSTQVTRTGITTGSVNLVRSSHSWTDANSAAGFVLRYLPPMRQQLTEVLGSEVEADLALKVLLTHLVSAGFGEHRKGRLRDFLIKAVRSCAKARLVELGKLSEDKSELSGVTLQSKRWLLLWRDCLLQRAWRSLERLEHDDPQRPWFSLLWTLRQKPKLDDAELASVMKQRTGLDWDAAQMPAMKLEAKAEFAQLLADEVVETLEIPDKTEVEKEIKLLGIASAFDGLVV